MITARRPTSPFGKSRLVNSEEPKTPTNWDKAEQQFIDPLTPSCHTPSATPPQPRGRGSRLRTPGGMEAPKRGNTPLRGTPREKMNQHQALSEQRAEVSAKRRADLQWRLKAKMAGKKLEEPTQSASAPSAIASPPHAKMDPGLAVPFWERAYDLASTAISSQGPSMSPMNSPRVMAPHRSEDERLLKDATELLEGTVNELLSGSKGLESVNTGIESLIQNSLEKTDTAVAIEVEVSSPVLLVQAAVEVEVPMEAARVEVEAADLTTDHTPIGGKMALSMSDLFEDQPVETALFAPSCDEQNTLTSLDSECMEETRFCENIDNSQETRMGNTPEQITDSLTRLTKQMPESVSTMVSRDHSVILKESRETTHTELKVEEIEEEPVQGGRQAYEVQVLREEVIIERIQDPTLGESQVRSSQADELAASFSSNDQVLTHGARLLEQLKQRKRQQNITMEQMGPLVRSRQADLDSIPFIISKLIFVMMCVGWGAHIWCQSHGSNKLM